MRAALDRVLVSLGGQLEADLNASAADILRTVSDALARTAAEAAERATAEAWAQAEWQIDKSRQEIDEVRSELAVTRRVAEDALAHAEAFRAGLRALDEASSLGDVFDALAGMACLESTRGALFLVKGDRLHLWRASGPDAADPATWSDATAKPVIVGGTVVAVLYADAAQTDGSTEARRPAPIDAMTTHAGRVLEGMTLRQAATLWALRGSLRDAHSPPGSQTRQGAR